MNADVAQPLGRLRWQWREPYSTSSRIGESYAKVRGEPACRYRAVDEPGNTVEFYRPPTRNTAVARRVLAKTLSGLRGCETLPAINTDKAPTYADARSS